MRSSDLARAERPCSGLAAGHGTLGRGEGRARCRGGDHPRRRPPPHPRPRPAPTPARSVPPPPPHGPAPLLVPLRHALGDGEHEVGGLVEGLLDLVQGGYHDDVGDGQHGVSAEERAVVPLTVHGRVWRIKQEIQPVYTCDFNRFLSSFDWFVIRFSSLLQ